MRATQSYLDHHSDSATTLSAALIESHASDAVRGADGDYWVPCPACGSPAALRLADTVLSDSPRCRNGCSEYAIQQALLDRLTRESPSSLATRESPSSLATRESPSSLATRESPSSVPLDENDGLSLASAEIARLGSDPDAVRTMMATLGITEPFRNFPCVLSSHRGDACLFLDDEGPLATGAYKYACRCTRDSPLMCTLGDLRRAVATQRAPQRLGGMELLPWFLRLACEAGRLPAVVPALPALASLSERHRPVADGFALLLGLRRTVHPGTSVAFGRNFAAPWCAVTTYQARAGIEAMREQGVIIEVGQTGGGATRRPTPLFVPGDEAQLAGAPVHEAGAA